MNEEFARIRGYLQSQAAKLTVPELVSKVRADLQQVKAAIESVPADCWHDRPSEGEWCANEVAAHLAGSSASVARGIESVIATGARPGRVADTIERTTDERSPADWWQTLKTDRETFFANIAGARGDEHLDVKWDHAMFGDLNWREWLLFMRIHDLDHARQIQAIGENK